MNDPRDELDRALSHGLSDLASGGDNADAVLAGMRPQLRRARTRYRATRIGTAAVVVLLAAGGVALLTPHRSSRITVNTQPTIAPATTVVPRRPHSRVATTTTTRPFTPVTAPSHLPGASTTVPVVTIPAPPIKPAPSDHGPQRVTTTTAPASTGFDKTYRSQGGTLTVHFANGKLTLVSYKAANGYLSELHTDQPDDIEVRFTGTEGEFRIEVRVENGKLVQVPTDE